MEIKILSQRDLKRVLNIAEVINTVENVYKNKARGQAAAWPLVEHHFESGAVMDIRSGGIFGDIGIHGAKLLNNFPANADKGLPVFTGVLMAFDSSTGIPIGVMDASYITSMRTGGAGAVSVRTLARKDSETLLIIGAGRQAFFQLAAVINAVPSVKTVLINDPLSFENAENFVSGLKERLMSELGTDSAETVFKAVENTEEGVRAADIVITVTRATKPVVKKEWVRPGTHITCIGADMIGKEEIDPELFRDARVFCDDIKQCCAVGESEIPFKTGVISADGFAGEIGQVLNGEKAGRVSGGDITIFDATGLAALDLATAKLAAEAAIEKGIGSAAEI